MSKTDTIEAVRFYVDKIVSDPTIGGMKALLLDSVTTKIVSMVYSQTQILEKEVYLVEQLGKRHEPMNHMKAAVFIQPTEANLTMLIAELREPKYAEYHLFFSNLVPSDLLSRLGRADENDMVKQVHEYFADFMPVNEDFFQLGALNSLSLSVPMARTVESGLLFDRNVNGILSLLLATKRKPAQIRYSGSSDLARRVASDVVTHIERDDVFEFRTPGPMLLILDRRDDPITPLLTQWTYQAMVHELLGLNHNRVNMRKAPGIKKDLEEVVLSCTQDEFFAENRYANFGDLGSAVKTLLENYQRESKLNEKLTSIEDMQNFMTRYPAFRSRSINVSKHVAVMGELARLTDVCQLLDISQLEQEIVCSNDHGTHKAELVSKLNSPRIQPMDKLRLVLLFLLRYESYDEVREMKSRLADANVSSMEIAKIDAMLDYAGEARRAPGLFGGSESIMSKFSKAMDAFSNVNGMQNVYTQHMPLLSATLENILKGKMKDSAFPLVMGHAGGRPSDIFIYMVGGATFEEATKVAEFNKTNTDMRVVLGGSCVHNSNSFLREVANSFGR
jgi:vacuolar protein sorting-associated protein 45